MENPIHNESVLGHNVVIKNGVIIEQDCEVGSDTFIGNYCILRAGTKIGSDCKIGHLTVFEENCQIGDRCLIQTQCYITKGVIIEDDVFIGSMFTGGNDRLMCHNRRHILDYKETPFKIKRAARLGINVTVLPGVVIQENAVIGAGSVVTKDVPPFEIWFGNPARKAGQVDKKEWI